MIVDGQVLRSKEIIDILVTMDGDYCHIGMCRDPYNAFSKKNPRTIDHILPRSKGGEDSFENFQLACQDCNSKKGDRVYLENGELEPKIVKERSNKANRKTPCEVCYEGRLLLHGEICEVCGIEPQPVTFPKWAQMHHKECPHEGVFHCFACVTGIVERIPARYDVFEEK